MLLAVIFAGGRGTRLGRPSKPLVSLGGKPLIRHVIERVYPQVDSLIVNTASALPGLDDLDLTTVKDAPNGESLPGLFRGLQTALTLCRDPGRGVRYVLTAPTDTPFLPRDMARALMVAADASGVAVVADGERAHPAVGLWSHAAAARGLAALANYQEQSLQGFILGLGGVVVPLQLAPDESFLNVNTEGDLRAAELFLAKSQR